MSEHQQSIHIVVGMPGSGKTTYLERLLTVGMVECYFDDYQKGAPREDGPESHAKSDPRLSPNHAALTAAMSAGKNVAIADIRYCLIEEQTLMQEFTAAEFPEATVVWTYFANNPDACRHNVRLRNRMASLERELHNIDIISPQYNPPQNRTIPVIMG